MGDLKNNILSYDHAHKEAKVTSKMKSRDFTRQAPSLPYYVLTCVTI